MGWENVLSCEYDPFCQKVLQHHFPTTTHYGDIRQLDGTKYRGQIDILTGGFPCQPFSAAGKRKGTEDNRFLWHEMLRVIREIQPTWIVAENVRGITSIDNGLVFERVCAEMEADGYEVQPFCIPACAVGAPHRRERMWFVAHYANARVESVQGWEKRANENAPNSHNTGGGTPLCNIDGNREEKYERWNSEPQLRFGRQGGNVTNPRCERREQGTNERVEPKRQKPEPADACNSHWSRESWLQAATRLCRVDDGLPRELDGITIPKWRKESLKAYGNAIVPQVAYQIFKSIS